MLLRIYVIKFISRDTTPCQPNFERKSFFEARFISRLKYVARLRKRFLTVARRYVYRGHLCESQCRILVKAGFPRISCSSNESPDINVEKRNAFHSRNVEIARFPNFIGVYYRNKIRSLNVCDYYYLKQGVDVSHLWRRR